MKFALYRILTLVLLGCWTAQAADRLHIGSLEVISAAGDKRGRELLNTLEQMRWVLGGFLGNPDIQPAWPVRVLLAGGGKSAVQPELRFARDAWVASAGGPDPVLLSSFARILVEANAGHIPAPIERGLYSLFSTFEADGTKLTLGAPPAVKDRDWSRVHMLAVTPEFSGKFRALLHNLQQGGDPAPAYRNAFEVTPEQLERKLDSYLQAGAYPVSAPSARPINPKTQLPAREASPQQLGLLQADLLLANGGAVAREQYEKFAAPDGSGLLALREGKADAARESFRAAMQADPKNARAIFELGRLDRDPKLLLEAARLQPRWSQPYRTLADFETIPVRKAAYLKKAAEIDVRDAALWRTLAETQEAANQMTDAAKSWAGAMRAASTPEERERTSQARLDSERKRTDQELAARAEERRKTQQELEDLRNRSLANIRAFEAKSNKGLPAIDRSKLDWYKEDESKNPKLNGLLQRVDCLAGQARLHIQTGQQTVVLLLRDPNKLVLSGAGEMSLECGPQKPLRRVIVQYISRPDAKLGTSGEVKVIEFR